MGIQLPAFKAYDVRGEFGTELTPELGQAAAHAMTLHLQAHQKAPRPLTIAIGHDMRSHSPALFEAVCSGVQQAGANVLDVGLVSTPMLYFAVNDQKTDGGIMVTASHNPAKDNGLKLCRENAIPIAGGSPDSELEQIKARVIANDLSPAPQPGTRTTFIIANVYAEKILELAPNCTQRFQIVADFANGMGTIEAQLLNDLFEIIPLHEDLDGTFPNHPANPLNHKNLADVSNAVRTHSADFGLAFDGDADRVGFVDENGEIIPMDLITGLIAQWYLKRSPSGNVLHDLRTSRATLETIRENGGTPIACRVGHSFLKQKMRLHNGIFGGELAGHFYFQELNYVESTALAVIRIASLMSETGQSLSELAAPLKKYANSGELNLDLPVRSAAASAIASLQAAFPEADASHLDGLFLETESWWCNVRPSNTEPRLRIVIEAQTTTQLSKLKKNVFSALGRKEIG